MSAEKIEGTRDPANAQPDCAEAPEVLSLISLQILPATAKRQKPTGRAGNKTGCAKVVILLSTSQPRLILDDYTTSLHEGIAS
jgi:hypothetical protein